ncbi:winged helix-turn-helix domain-containing protein [Streptomyces sp. NPDC056721]|uniref:winged helix-turn-helix domain-containing protein n=1 Tax=unclassified Streptomyces TaxID=2593676 RepID=UPI0036860720
MSDTATDAAADDLPKFYEFFAPALAVLEAGKTMQTRDIVAEVSDRLGLNTMQRNQVIPSGQRRLDNRVTWALSYLFHAEAVRKP